MKRILISLFLSLLLVSIMALPAMADEVTQEVGASVSIGEIISATIVDNGDSGLLFGSMAKGEGYKAEAAQNGIGAVTITVAAETNVDCAIGVKATDFEDTSTSEILSITNAKYGTTNAEGSATAFAAANTYYSLGSHTVGATATTVEAYHWLQIPNDQVAGSYESTFTYYVGKSLP
jgi:hypothetical protein